MPELARIETPLKTVLDDEGRRQTWLADQLTEKLGRPIDARQVWGWVHGIHLPEQATRQAIADVLGRHVDELWPPDPEQTPVAA